MRYNELFEARRNPVQNPRMNEVEFVAQYKDRPNIYLHTTSVEKVGIYPKSSDSHDSPTGIYAYRIADIYEDDIARWNNEKYNRGLSHLSYHGGDHLYILRSDISINFPKDYTEDDLQRDTAKLAELYQLQPNDIARLRRAARTNPNFRDMPAGYLWGMTKALAAGGLSELDEYTSVDCKRWNGVLRALGYTGFNDPGYGLIHGTESSQALFLTTQAFTVIDHMQKNQKQKEIKIADKVYKGGRMPRDLVMKGFDSVFFHNNEPEDFKNVQRWTVDGMSYDQFWSFARFLPWNAQGIIKRLGGFEGSFDKRANYDIEFLKNVTVPKIPEGFPVGTITISKFSDNYVMDNLPGTIQQKIIRV